MRFNGFDEPWGQHQLHDVAQIIGGGTPSTAIDAYWDGTINWFTPAELGNEVFLSHSERKITQLALKQSSTKLLPKGTVLFTSRAGIGKTAILASESATNQGFQSIVPNQGQLDSYFIFSCSGLLKSYGESVGGGSTFKEVSGKQMGALALLIPPLEEQQRIGSLFRELDRNLSLNRALLDKLTKLKTSLLEQMFPGAGKSVPQLRFEGFTSTWTTSLLGDISTKISDGVHNLPPPAKVGAGTPILSAKDIDDFGNLLFNNVNRYAAPKDFQIEQKRNGGVVKGDLLLTIVGSIGRVTVVETEHRFMLQRSVAIVKPNLNLICSDFLQVAISHPLTKTWLQDTAAGSNQKGIYLSKLETMQIQYPSLAEQQRIGAFFKAMDERIAQQRAKLSKLEQLKQALLKQMLVSAPV